MDRSLSTMNDIFNKKPKFFIGTEVEKTHFHKHRTLFVRGDVSLSEILTQLKTADVDHVYLGSSKTHNALWDNKELPEDVLALLTRGFYVTLECDAEVYKDMICFLGARVVSDPDFCLNISVSLPVWAIDSVALKLEPLEPFTDGEGVFTFVAEPSRITTWEEYNGDKEIE